MKIHFLLFSALFLSGCASFGEPPVIDPLYNRVGHRKKDTKVLKFGMKRALGNVVFERDLIESNPHEVDIALYGLRCAQTRGFNVDLNIHSFIVTEYLTEKEAENSLTKHLGRVIDSQDIGAKTTYLISDDQYSESTRLVRARVNHHNQIFRTQCRMYNANVGGSVEYAVAIFDKKNVQKAKNDYFKEL